MSLTSSDNHTVMTSYPLAQYVVNKEIKQEEDVSIKHLRDNLMDIFSGRSGHSTKKNNIINTIAQSMPGPQSLNEKKNTLHAFWDMAYTNHKDEFFTWLLTTGTTVINQKKNILNDNTPLLIFITQNIHIWPSRLGPDIAHQTEKNKVGLHYLNWCTHHSHTPLPLHHFFALLEHSISELFALPLDRILVSGRYIGLSLASSS